MLLLPLGCAACCAVLAEMCGCCEQYYHVESEGNPETDPLTLWLNGASEPDLDAPG